MLIIAGTVKIRLHERNALVEAATHMMQQSQKEPGCLAYTITADLADPAQFHLFEQWENQAALDDHFKSPHMVDFQEIITDKIEHMNIQKYEVTAIAAD